MTFGYILFILVPIAAVAYIVWDYRRKTAQREAVRAGRLTELMGTATQVQTQAPPQTAPPQPSPQPVERAAPVVAQAARTEAPAPDVSLYAQRERVLSPPQTLLYLLLKTGLADHNVFARVSLASIVEAGPGLSGVARDEQTRRLAALTVDFVVADKNMRPVAVIELAAADEGGVAQTDRASARSRLTAAGLRYVELDARKLPRKDAIRAAVLGDAQPAAAAPASVAR